MKEPEVSRDLNTFPCVSVVIHLLRGLDHSTPMESFVWPGHFEGACVCTGLEGDPEV